MRQARLGRVLVMLAVAAFPALLGAQAAPAPAGVEPQGGQRWLILGKLKGKKGFQLSGGSCYSLYSGSEGKGQIEVHPVSNPDTGATGALHIFEQGDACKCLHRFHGTLFGLADPEPTGCGWGCAILFDSATPQIQSLGDAFDKVNRAQNLLAEVLQQPDAQKAQDAYDLLDDSIDDLNEIAPLELTAAKKKKKPNLVKVLQGAVSTTVDVMVAIEFSNGGQDFDQILFATLLCDSVKSADRDAMKALKPVLPRG